MGRRKKLRVGDAVLYTIPDDLEREWTITGTFPSTEGTILCLSRPDPEKKLKVDRCNAMESNCTVP